MCRALANVPLELDAYRCAALAHELSKAYKDAWNANVKALGLVDQLSASERENATLVPLVDAMLRITQHRELRSYRDALANELRRRGLHGST